MLFASDFTGLLELGVFTVALGLYSIALVIALGLGCARQTRSSGVKVLLWLRAATPLVVLVVLITAGRMHDGFIFAAVMLGGVAAIPVTVTFLACTWWREP